MMSETTDQVLDTISRMSPDARKAAVRARAHGMLLDSRPLSELQRLGLAEATSTPAAVALTLLGFAVATHLAEVRSA